MVTFLRWTPPADDDDDDDGDGDGDDDGDGDGDDDEDVESDPEPDAPQETRLPASPPDSPTGAGEAGSNHLSDNHDDTER